MLKMLIYKWLDRDTREADLIVHSEDIEFIVYCSCYVEASNNAISLFSLYTGDIFLTNDSQTIEKKKDGGFYSYVVVAQVASLCPPCVKLSNDISIELDCAIPKDIQIGQNIQFCTERLSLL